MGNLRDSIFLLKERKSKNEQEIEQVSECFPVFSIAAIHSEKGNCIQIDRKLLLIIVFQEQVSFLRLHVILFYNGGSDLSLNLKLTLILSFAFIRIGK